MKPFLIVWLVALTAVSGSGCGTICNFAGGLIHPDDEPRVYGGVLRDFEVIEGLSNPPLWPHGLHASQNNSNDGMVLLVGCCLGVMVADPALSFAADTLTLPITICVQRHREAACKSGAEGAQLPSASPSATDPNTADEPHVLDRTCWIDHLLAETPVASPQQPAAEPKRPPLAHIFETDAPHDEQGSDLPLFGPISERRLER